jgi:hypothetical protein
VDNLYTLNINSINDLPQAIAAIKELFNISASLIKENRELKEGNQKLRDEIALLKGEKGKPVINSNTKPKNPDLSSTAHTGKKKKWNKGSKKDIIKIDKTVTCPVDKGLLPPDVQFKGYDRRVSQNIVFKRENIEYLIELYYSPSENKTYRGELPNDSGYFANNLKALSVLMHNFLDVPRNKLLRLFESMGIEMSVGSLNNILQDKAQMWIDEKNDLLRAGLSGAMAQTDITGARVCGKNHYTHIICGEHFTVYNTLSGKSRRDVLMAFAGELPEGLFYQYNSHTLRLLEHFKVSKDDKQTLSEIFKLEQIVSETEFVATIEKRIPALHKKTNIFKRVCDSFALAYFYEHSPLKILVSDDAPEYELIALIRMLCWIHDARHYKKLIPVFDHHRDILNKFLDKYWNFYDSLLDYKQNPKSESAEEIKKEFDLLLDPGTDYADLNKEIKRTKANKDKLLTVLEYPFLPLHNNHSELAARVQVRKRDIALHTMTALGTKLQDAFMSIIQTCLQLEVDVWQYILNRFNNNESNYLPEMVRMKYNSS